LKAFADFQFDLSFSKAGGASKRDHLESVERQTGHRPAQLDGPACPDELGYLWEWWQEIQSACSGDGITYADIVGWSALHHLDLTRFEIQGLTTLNTAYRAAVAAQQKAPK